VRCCGREGAKKSKKTNPFSRPERAKSQSSPEEGRTNATKGREGVVSRGEETRKGVPAGIKGGGKKSSPVRGGGAKWPTTMPGSGENTISRGTPKNAKGFTAPLHFKIGGFN